MKYDFHEHTLEEALNKAHEIIGNVRLRGIPVDAEFIVGHGVIRNELNHLLADYGLTPTIKLGNAGVILCHIE